MEIHARIVAYEVANGIQSWGINVSYVYKKTFTSSFMKFNTLEVYNSVCL
jgi:hypothetical protein